MSWRCRSYMVQQQEDLFTRLLPSIQPLPSRHLRFEKGRPFDEY